MLHTFVAYVEDRPGVLTRVASLFRRLNINIISLTVGRSERAGQSRMTMVAEASAEAGNRIRASLYKLENVIEVDDIGLLPSVTRELALIKVAVAPSERSYIFQLAETFRARIVDLAHESLMIEITGVESKIEGLIQMLSEDEGRILEICRSGKMTMRRGHHTSRVLKAMEVGEAETDAQPLENLVEGDAVEQE
ncbi:MAG: acetolactate synthase small subunit [Terracidiphilus sp.]|nr:acetolactate synthase small subunit [Terracidiphilus sp.]MDR3775585.1 acetolactate synthase small subunit [Terracidiphilus sp.]